MILEIADPQYRQSGKQGSREGLWFWEGPRHSLESVRSCARSTGPVVYGVCIAWTCSVPCMVRSVWGSMWGVWSVETGMWIWMSVVDLAAGAGGILRIISRARRYPGELQLSARRGYALRSTLR
jgi:hypothetical protein